MKQKTPIKIGRMTFEMHKIDTMNGVQVQFIEVTKQTDMIAFSVVCSSEGILFRGDMSKPIRSQSDLSDFAEFVSNCWKEHKKLGVTITSDLAGHKPV